MQRNNHKIGDLVFHPIYGLGYILEVLSYNYNDMCKIEYFKQSITPKRIRTYLSSDVYIQKVNLSNIIKDNYHE